MGFWLDSIAMLGANLFIDNQDIFLSESLIKFMLTLLCDTASDRMGCIVHGSHV